MCNGVKRWLSGQESTCQAEDAVLIPGLGGSPGGGNGNPFQYSCAENPTDRGAWWATVDGFAKGQTRLSTHAAVSKQQSGELSWKQAWSLTAGGRLGSTFHDIQELGKLCHLLLCHYDPLVCSRTSVVASLVMAEMVKASAYSAGDPGLTPGLGRSSGEGNGNPLQYSCLENPTDREAC